MTIPTSQTRADVLAELLARVEAAEGPDRELFLSTAEAVIRDYRTAMGWRMTFNGFLGVEAWTDAALALCERALPGCWREVSEQSPDHSWMAEVMDADFKVTCVSWAKTPALAVLAAMLKALIAQEAAT